MTKEVFSDLATLVNGVSAINGIITEIETAFDNTLSRDGSSPNQMLASLDMNSNRILNLPLPSANTEPARLIDIFNYLSFPSGSDRESLTFKREGAPANQVYWRLSTSGTGEPGLDLLSDALVATPVLSISRTGSTPTRASLFAPVTITSTMSGAQTGQYGFNYLNIYDGAHSNPSGNSYGLYVKMTGRDPTSIGGRFAFGALCQWDTPGDPASAAGFNFAGGGIFQAIGNYDNSTTGAVTKPQLTAGNSNVVALATCKDWGGVTAHDFDVTTYAGADYVARNGIGITLGGTGPQGTTRDAAIVFRATTGTTNGFQYLMQFDNLSGGKPIAADGTVLGSIGAIPIGYGIDMYSTTISNYFLRGPADNFHVTGTGGIAGANITVKGPVTINTVGAPANQTLVRLNTDTNGVLLVQAVTDDGLTADTYMRFTRSGGTAAAVSFDKKAYFPAPADLAGINLAPGSTPTTLQDGDIFPITGSLFARLNGTTKQFVFSGDAYTWSGIQTFSVAPIFSSLTGYVKANGAAQLTAAATVPSADFADGNTGTGAVAHAASPAFTGNPTAPTQAPNDNSTKIATTAYADAIATAAGSTYAKKTVVQVFTANGTYTPTTGMKIATVYAFGGGGGGGSGARNAAGAATGGGSGGGGGGLAQAWFTAEQIGASQSVTIGAGGTGGAAQTVNATAGNSGTVGGNTTLGSLLYAGGGGGGQGGALAANSGGGGAGTSGISGTSGSGGTGGVNGTGVGSGGSGVAGGAGLTQVGAGSGGAGSPAAGTAGLAGGYTNALFGGGAGGGSGGGITAADAASNGGTGGTLYVGGVVQRGAAGTVGAGQAGGAGPTFANSGGPINQSGSGAGGGASNLSATAGSGGVGGLGGGGGGGGGASRDGFDSGAGGDGGAGLIIIVEQF